jgi:hypothetical protein
MKTKKEKNMIILFALLCPVLSVMIVKDYDETNVVKGDGSLITIKMDTPEMDISQVTWCKSPIPNPVTETDRIPVELDECRAPGLMHMQLFPNTRNLVQLPISEPGTIYIDSINLGGPDTRHQFNIMVTTASGITLCVRFNPLQTVKHAVETSTPPPLVFSSSSFGLETSASSSSSSSLDKAKNSMWMPSFVVFLAGIFVIVLGAIVIRHRQRIINPYRKREQGFEFELVERHTDSDLELLTVLGKGADPAFFVNK